MKEPTDWGKTLKNLAALSLKALLLSDIIVLFNFILVSSLQSDAELVIYLVSLATILEGGLGLTIGGAAVITAGPTVSKVTEKVLHGAPYSAKRARSAEGTAKVFFFFSTFLLAIGFLISL